MYAVCMPYVCRIHTYGIHTAYIRQRGDLYHCYIEEVEVYSGSIRTPTHANPNVLIPVGLKAMILLGKYKIMFLNTLHLK